MKIPINNSRSRFDTSWKDSECKSSLEEIFQDAAQRDDEMETGKVDKEARRTDRVSHLIRVLKGEKVKMKHGEYLQRWREWMKDIKPQKPSKSQAE